MLAAQIRSDLVETTHQGAVAVVGATGELLASHGDIDRPFFIRSASKPFQAFVSQQLGAGLDPLELAMACSSHRGFPVHIALVRSMLKRAQLDEEALQCPPAWPIGPAAARMVQRAGRGSPRKEWNNCSGKHAGFLRACAARGWPVDTYLDPGHPLQERVIATINEWGGYPVRPVGVDGCGAPVMRTTARALATLFARLATDADLAEVYAAMHRYPSLVAANGEGDTEIGTALNAVAKGGAAGCLGVAVEGRVGLGVKSWDGLGLVANLAATAALDQLGVLTQTARSALEPILHPAVLGGGRKVGRFEPRFELEQR